MAYQGLIEDNVHSVNISSMTKTTLARIFILTMSIPVKEISWILKTNNSIEIMEIQNKLFIELRGKSWEEFNTH